MIELILVVVLVGVLAFAAAPRFFNLSVFGERGFYESALSMTRFAQKLAVATGCNVRVMFSASGYVLNWNTSGCQSLTFPDAVPHPTGGGVAQESAPTEIVVGSGTVIFDAAGRPRNAGGAFIAAPLDVTIGSRTLRVEPESGYVHTP